MKWIKLSVFASAVLVSATSSQAADWSKVKCFQPTNPDQKIVGCSRVLARGKRESSSIQAMIYAHRAYAYVAKRDLDRALVDYDQAIRLNRQLAPAYNSRGLVYKHQGEHGRALSDFSHAIRFDPKNITAYLLRAEMYVENGEYDRAIADYNRAIQFSPKDSRGYTGRGEALGLKGAWDQSLADFKMALFLDPTNQKARIRAEVLRIIKRAHYESAKPQLIIRGNEQDWL